MTEILEEAVEALFRRWLLLGIASDYAKLHENSRAWRAEQTERQLWDETLQDGRIKNNHPLHRWDELA